MPQIAGGCLCGKVRYSANTEPAFVGICHCKDCQKFTGSAFAVAIGVPEAALSVQGELAAYSKTGDSGQVDRAELLPSVRFVHSRRGVSVAEYRDDLIRHAG